MRRYRRLNQIEERNNIRSAVIYISLTIGVILIILFLGIPAMGRIAGFIHDIRSSGQKIEVNDTTPPAPPKIETLPEVTNKTSIEVVGKTEAGVTVKIKANDKEVEVVANKEGSFTYDWAIWKGENKLSLIARDQSGNESQETKTFTISYDNTAPDLVISSPTNGQQFSGTKQRQVTIKGTTEEGATLTINDRIVAVDEDGSFSFFTTMTEGENKYTIVSKDKATNETKRELSVVFNP